MSPTSDGSLFPDIQAEQNREVEEVAKSLLQTDGHLFNQGIECEFDEGTMTLKGKVATYFQKQLAQVLVSELPAVRNIVNQIEVTTGAPR